MPLERILRQVITRGALTYIDPSGRRHDIGDPTAPPSVVMRIRDTATNWRVALNPKLAVGEAYMDGKLLFEAGSLYDFLSLVTENLGHTGELPFSGFTRLFDRVMKQWHQLNGKAAATRRVRHHYDLDGRLYDLFLDSDRQYSCAYFATPDTTLEQAQLAKKRHIAAKLRLKPGQRVLDIGSGWGGMALYLAQVADVDVVGITLSKEQHALATKRAEERGLAHRVKFEICDYRDLKGEFDRIVSVGMFEHVGLPHYADYFASIRRLLKQDGVALLHAIGRTDGPGATPAFIRKYIFPGGYSPALSEVVPHIERSGLWTTDIEILRLHYAETLRAWRQRFMAHWDKARQLYDERFCRMWEFYLAASEVTFRHWGHMVFQIQMAKEVGALPITRDYMFEAEAELARREKPLAAYAPYVKASA